MFEATDGGVEGFEGFVEGGGVASGHFVHLVHDDGEGNGVILHPIEHIFIESGEGVSGVDDQKDEAELRGVSEVIVDHFRKSFAFFERGFGVAVAGKVDQIEPIVDVVEVEGLGSTRVGTDASELFLAGEVVDE